MRELDRDIREHATTLHSEGLGHVVTVSAGAITLLVTFRTALLGAHPKALLALKFCWASFALAVVSAVICKLVTSRGLLSLLAEHKPNARTVYFDRWEAVLATTAMYAFLAGVVSLTWFGIANL